MTEQSDDDQRNFRDRDFQQQVLERLDQLSDRVDKLSSDGERFNDRFSDYQQATQWVVQLAFTLIASATVTVILTTVFKR
ncbi:hypothetical protein ACKFKG_22815 [Phormidesmis sp. 146-35]